MFGNPKSKSKGLRNPESARKGSILKIGKETSYGNKREPAGRP